MENYRKADKKSHRKHLLLAGMLAALAFSILPAHRCLADMGPFELLDQTSKAKEIGAGVERHSGPAELDAAEPFYRFTQDGGYIDLELDCDPREQNYFTVKVWGSSGSGGQPGSILLLRHPEKGDKPFGHIPYGHNRRKHPRKGEIVKQHEADPFPGRFYYATYPIPLEITRGNSSIELRLLYKGSEPGEDVYKVYTHLGSFFKPPADELQGEPFVLGPPREPDAEQASAEERHEHWKSESNRGVRRALEMQLYGEQWEEHIEQGKAPEWARGAFLARGGKFPSGPYEKLEGEIHRWGSWLIRQADSGLPSFRYLEVFARAYQEEWSEFYQNEELLERIVSALDFYVRAQGSGGGWQGPALQGRDVNWPTWLGGPDRSDFMPGLETGQRYLYNALRMIYEDLEAADLLEVRIDHDLNPQNAKISRREAYAEMAERSFDLYEEQVHARPIANQVIHNYIPLYQVWKTIREFEPQRAAPEERVLELAEIAAGIRCHPRWGSYMYSPRGMPLEDGYDANYGNGGMQMVELAELTEFPTLEEKARDVFDAYAHFMYLSNDQEGKRVLRNTEWISARVMKGFPGRQRYFLSEYAARELQIPAAIRYYELYQEHHQGRPQNRGRDLERLDFRTPPGLWSRIIHAIKSVNTAREEKEGRGAWYLDLPPTDYRLPDEREEDSAFVDEHLGLVALRHGEARMFALLNWESRGGREWVAGKPNNIVRLRYTTPTIDRLVTAKSMNTPGKALGLSTMRYGPYFVVLNGSEEESCEYEVPADVRGAMATDLLTGEQGELKDGTIAPSSSRVFAVDSKSLVSKSAEAFKTYCNPLNINYTMTEKRGRHAADPEIVLFKDKYYLFTTWDIEGCRVSDDLFNWKDVLFSEETWKKLSAGEITAPAVATDGDYVYFINGVTRKGEPAKIFRTRDPELGVWEVCGSIRRLRDPSLYIEKGRFFIYHGLGARSPTQVFELDPETFTEIPGSNKILRPAKSGVKDYIGGYHRGRRELFGEIDAADWFGKFSNEPCPEAPYMTKYRNKYYLQYATPGTVSQWYSDIVMEGDSPTGPFEEADYNPVSMKVGGFIGSAGHSCVFQDKDGLWWRITTMWVGRHHLFERRLGLFPVTFDEKGRMITHTVLGDYPRFKKYTTANGACVGPDWYILSYDKKLEASSTLDGCNVENAVDENVRTWWSAETGDPGEWLAIDLGEQCRINAVQVNFAKPDLNLDAEGDPDYHAYKIFSSDDGKEWNLLIDKSENRSSVPHDYIALDAPLMARYLKIENVHTPLSGKFALSGLRIFGKGKGKPPAKVEIKKAQRDSSDSRNAIISWQRARNATGYLVRFGVAPDIMNQCIQVNGNEKTELSIHVLMKDRPYFFRVDAFNENGMATGEISGK